jgi:hypothetical protein
VVIPGPRVAPRPVPAPSEPIAYAWPETPPTGLRKFNLGTIPASVTPPRTWRKAAWFAVGTAVFVVLALGFAAMRLVGNPRRTTVLDALPGQPSQQLLITDLPTGTVAPHPTSSAPAPTTTTTRTTTTRPSGTKPAPKRTVRTGDAAADAAPDGEHPARPNSVQSTKAPARSTVEAPLNPPTDPGQLGDRTEQYYAQVCDNPTAAYELTAGAMHAEGPEGIEARYASIDHIEVKEITIDPSWSYTRSVLKVVRKDGSTVTIKRELTFSPGTNPKITSDNASR